MAKKTGILYAVLACRQAWKNRTSEDSSNSCKKKRYSEKSLPRKFATRRSEKDRVRNQRRRNSRVASSEWQWDPDLTRKASPGNNKKRFPEVRGNLWLGKGGIKQPRQMMSKLASGELRVSLRTPMQRKHASDKRFMHSEASHTALSYSPQENIARTITITKTLRIT